MNYLKSVNNLLLLIIPAFLSCSSDSTLRVYYLDKNLEHGKRWNRAQTHIIPYKKENVLIKNAPEDFVGIKELLLHTQRAVGYSLDTLQVQREFDAYTISFEFLSNVVYGFFFTV